MEQKYESLRLQNQMCFPLYAAAREVVKRYRPYLEKIDLTYTQYIVMMVLWEEEECSVKSLCEKLYLDSGTLTPVLKSLETKGFLTRRRSESDERIVLVRITDSGFCLREKAVEIPSQIAGCIALKRDEALTLYTLLYKLLSDATEKSAKE